MAFSDPSQPFQPYNPYGGGMMMNMVSSYIAGNYGLMPMGFQGGNMYNNARMFEQTEQQRHAVSMGARADIPVAMDIMRGVYQMSGQAWTPEVQQQALRMAETGVNLAAMGNPRMLDSLMGGRSATAMSVGMFNGGRYSFDPVYGDIGVSGNSVGAMTRDIHGYFYGDRRDEAGNPIAGTGAAEWRRRTKGVTAGEMGQLYSRLSREGMMSSIAPMSNREMRQFENATEGEQGAIKAERRAGQAKNVAKTLESWTGALAALKDVFGQDAPFDHLMTAMEQMTGGSLSQMGGIQAERTIRNLVASGRLSGVDAGTMMQRSAQLSSQMESMGINPMFGSQFAIAGANFTAGYRASGAGSVNAWGLFNVDRQRQEHTKNLVNASQSRLSNRMGAALRIADRAGINTFSGEAKDLIKKLRNGEIPEQYASMSTSEFIDFLADNSDMSRQEVQYALNSKTANQEMVHEYGLAESVQGLQRIEMRDKFLTPALGRSARTSVASAIGRSKGASALGTDLGGVMADTISEMDANTLADSDKRNDAIADSVERHLEAEAKRDPSGPAARYLKSLGPKGSKERKRKLLMFAEQGYSSMESTLQRTGVIGANESYVNFGVRNAPGTTAATANIESRAELEAHEAGAVAGISGGGPVQRVSEYIQNGAPGGIPGAIGAGLGLVPGQHVGAVLSDRVSNLDRLLENEKDKDTPNQARIKAIEAQRSQYMRMAENYGLVNERGEISTAREEGGGDVTFDPNISFQGATVILNGAEIMAEADGGVEYTGTGRRNAN